MAKSSVLAKCKNMFGETMLPEYQRKIKRFLKNPNTDTWDDIHGIIIEPEHMTTIWQAILTLDPTFPRTGRRTRFNGIGKEDTLINDWERIPTPLQVLQAIKEVIRD